MAFAQRLRLPAGARPNAALEQGLLEDRG